MISKIYFSLFFIILIFPFVSANQEILQNNFVKLTFDVDSSGLYGLNSVEDLSENYLHDFGLNSPAWEIYFLDNSNNMKTYFSSLDSSCQKSFNRISESNFEKILMVWDNCAVSPTNVFKVEQTYLLKQDEPFAHISLDVEGINLNSYSIFSLNLPFEYNSIPQDSEIIFPVRHSFKMINPQTNSILLGNGFFNEQSAYGDHSVLVKGTKSLLYLARYDSEGYHVQDSWKSDGQNVEISLKVYGDKHKISNQDFSQPYDLVIGAFPGKKELDWEASTFKYKKWYENQDFYPGLILDRQDIPDNFKKIDVIGAITNDATFSTQDYLDRLAGPSNLFGISTSAYLFFAWNAGNSNDFFKPSDNLILAMPSLKSSGIISLMFAPLRYLNQNDLNYQNRFPEIENSVIRDIDGNLQLNFLGDYIFYPGLLSWKQLLFEEYKKYISDGTGGIYLDNGNSILDYAHGNSGGGNYFSKGARELMDYLHNNVESLDEDFVLFTEANFEKYADKVDFVLGNNGHSTKPSIVSLMYGSNPSPLPSETELNNIQYIPAERILQSGRVIQGGASDRGFINGYADANSYILQFATGLSHGKIPAITEFGIGIIYIQGQVFQYPLGISTDSSTWDSASKLIFEEINGFTKSVFENKQNYAKYIYYGEMLRKPISNSQIVPVTFGDVAPFNFLNTVNFEKSPVTAWKALDGTIGFFIANTQNSSSSVSFEINFEDYGLDIGTNYNVYDVKGDKITYLVSINQDSTISLNLKNFEIKTIAVVNPLEDFDNDTQNDNRFDGNVWDNCPLIFNPLQEDSDLNGIGDLCENLNQTNTNQTNTNQTNIISNNSLNGSLGNQPGIITNHSLNNSNSSSNSGIISKIKDVKIYTIISIFGVLLVLLSYLIYRLFQSFVKDEQEKLIDGDNLQNKL